LNFLTWPEILRQFGLCAGFGPQLKKRNAETVYYREDNEVLIIGSLQCEPCDSLTVILYSCTVIYISMSIFLNGPYSDHYFLFVASDSGISIHTFDHYLFYIIH